MAASSSRLLNPVSRFSSNILEKPKKIPFWIDRILYGSAYCLCLLTGRNFFWSSVLKLGDDLRFRPLVRFAMSQLNGPKSVQDWDARGSRRWSFYVKADKKKKESTTGNNYWTIIVTITSGCSGQTITYSCNCPDKAKQVAPAAAYEQDLPDTLGKKFTPRIFPIENKSEYGSQFQRYMRAFKLIEEIEYRGIINGNQQVYRFYTERGEKYQRNWVSSGAGVSPTKDCKHQWAIKLFRKDAYTIPTDVPEGGGDGF